MQQQTFSITVANAELRGFIHLPDHVSLDAIESSLPVVIMANGYATEWQFGTSAFIQAFTDAGLATVNFDYRGFGGSDNQLQQPRQIVDIPQQLNDCRAVIKWVEQQSWADKDRLVMWGSSLGGGHALSMAAEFRQLKATVAQVPHCDSREAFKTVALADVFKGMSSAIRDAVRGKMGREPLLIPVLSQPDSYGVMNHTRWLDHYMLLAKGSGTWVNAIPARSLLRGGDYRPVTTADKIVCPTLLVAGRLDAGVPFSSVEVLAGKIADATLSGYEGDHFEVYHGPLQAGIVAEQLSFILQHV